MDESTPATGRLGIRLGASSSVDAPAGGEGIYGQQLIGTVDLGVGIVDIAEHGVAAPLARMRLDRLRSMRAE